jgi:hypothetical protein
MPERQALFNRRILPVQGGNCARIQFDMVGF